MTHSSLTKPHHDMMVTHEDWSALHSLQAVQQAGESFPGSLACLTVSQLSLQLMIDMLGEGPNEFGQFQGHPEPILLNSVSSPNCPGTHFVD